MKPERKFISIHDNIHQIEKMLEELVVNPRVKTHEWSELTKQSPALKIGYIGQYLASLVLGMPGSRSAARGKDIIDGTEVKTCYKVDQVDECKECGNRVMRSEVECPVCHSTDIKRKDDSKWLFNIRNQKELDELKNTDRILLTLFDYPNFSNEDFKDIRIESFEIYPKNQRMRHFGEMLERHYTQSYLPKIKSKGKANPMNFHPHKLDFYLCNPIKVFSALIENIDTHPNIKINEYVQPDADRTNLPSVDMPISILTQSEQHALFQKTHKILQKVNEEQRKFIVPRKYTTVDQTAVYKAK